MQTKYWFWTVRSFILVLLCAVGIGFLHASDASTDGESVSIAAKPDAERTYLYYFESGESLLDRNTPDALYAFGTLPKEDVTIVVYGLDDLIDPSFTLYDLDGSVIAEALPTNNPHVAIYQFTATENRRYDLTVTKRNTDPAIKGLVRVMLFKGAPISEDRTLLDNVNPLLPGRSFMVGGKPKTDTQPGLQMQVEALPVARFNDQRPEIFASRGSDDFMPTLPERIDAQSFFEWFNVETPDIQFYTVTIRATPETMDGMATLKFRQLNTNSFFYYDYYLIIGAGSDPVSVTRGDDCQSQPNRIECIKNSGSESGRTAPAPRLEAVETTFVEAVPVAPVVIDTLPPAPPITIGICDGLGNNTNGPINGTNFDDPSLGGTTCNDVMNGFDGVDNIAGGPGNDTLNGGDGGDILRGDDGQDTINGGAGDDRIDGGAGYDLIYGGTGNNNIGYLSDTGYDHIYYDDVVGGTGVTLNLNTGTNTTGSRICSAVVTGGTPYTGYVLKVGGEVDCIRGQFDATTTIFDDIVTNNAAQANYIETLAGNDTVNVIGNGLVFTGAGNDVVNFSGAIFTIIYDSDANNPSSGWSPENYDPVGNETYNFKDGVTGFVTIDDQGGTDLIDFSNITTSVAGVIANLQSGTSISVQTTVAGSVSVNFAAGTFENLNATNKDDTIITSTANNVINTLAGNDIIFGSCGTDTLNAGADTDTLDYSTLPIAFATDPGVTVALASTATKAACAGATDTLSGFENLNGSNGVDTLGGDGLNNIINGNAGNDIINAGGGNDTLNGGAGIDAINGEDGNDIVLVNTINDANDNINGGAGTDTLNASAYSFTFFGFPIGVNVNLSASTYGSFFFNGTITGVENVTGSNAADTITGDAGANVINSGGGNDIVNGGGGNDTIDTGTGTDTITASTGNDTIDGGANAAGTAINPGDSVSYQGFTGNNYLDVTVNGTTATVQIQNTAFTQNLSNVENVIGSTANAAQRSKVVGANTVNYYDYVLINAGIAGIPASNTSPSFVFKANTAPVGTATLYEFSASATGAVVLDNNATDSIDFGGATGAGFDPDLINVYQSLSGGTLYVMITTPLNSFCPAAGLTVLLPLNGTTSRTQCATNDIFTGAAGTETVSYVPNAVGLNLTVNINGNSLTVTGTGLGTDTLTNVENVLLGSGSQTVVVQAAPTDITKTSLIDLGTGTNHTLDMRLYGTDVTVDLSAGISATGSTSAINFAGSEGFTTYYGSTNSDIVTGNALNNLFIVITDGANDTYIGGTGTDTLTYDPTSVGLNVTIDGIDDRAVDGASLDRWRELEIVNTGDAADTFAIDRTGALAGSILPTINAGAGDDVFNIVNTGASSAVPVLLGQAGNDTYNITWDGFNNVYDGGAVDSDTVSYTDATPLTLILNMGDDFASSGGVTDTLQNMEVINLGTGGDAVTVNDATGYTLVNSGGGNDSVTFNLVNTTTVFDGGAGLGDAANFAALGTATVNYTSAAAQTAVVGGVTQQLQNFEAFTTGAANDTFNVTSDAVVNTFNGNGGTDTVVLTSGTGATITNSFFFGLTITDGGATDSYFNIENVTGTAQDDTLNVNQVFGLLDNVANIYDGAGTSTVTGNTANYNTSAALTLGVTAGGTVTVAQAGGDVLQNFQVVVSGTGNDTWTMSGVGADRTFDANVGTDSADYSSVVSGLNFTMNTADTTVANGGFTHTLRNFETIIAGAGSDTWTVNNGLGTTLKTFNGGGGLDTVSYNDTTSNLSYTAILTAGGNTVDDSDVPLPPVDTDTLISIETLTLDDAGDDVTIDSSTVVTVNTLGGDDLIRAGSAAGLDTVANTFAMGTGASDDLWYLTSPNALTINYTGTGAGTVVEALKATDTFTGVENIAGGSGNDTFNVAGDATNNIFYGQGGSNTIDYTDVAAITANLGVGIDTVVSGTGTDTLSFIQTVIGTTQDDTFNVVNGSGFLSLQGDAGNDTFNMTNTGGVALDGGAGNDTYKFNIFDAFSNTITDAAGNNIVDYSTVAPDLTVVLDPTVNTTVTSGAVTDTFTGVFTTFDTGTGNDMVLVQRSLAGTTIRTNGGDDTVTLENLTTSGTIDGGTNTAAGDTITLSSVVGQTVTVSSCAAATAALTATPAITTAINNFESFVGGTGADTFNVAWSNCDLTFNGLGGIDTVDYVSTTGTGLTFSLSGTTDTVTNGGANNHTIISFAVVRGSNQADTFNVTGAGETQYTNLFGNGGDDTFNLDWGATNNTSDGGTGTNTYIATGTMVNLNVAYTGAGAATVADGAATDTLSNIQNITTGGGDDTFVINGDAVNNTFDAGANITPTGDIADYTLSGAGLTFNLDGGTETVVVGAGTDTLVNFEGIIASNQADIFNVTGAGEAQYASLDGMGGNDTFNIDWGATANAVDGGTGTNSYAVTGPTTNLTVTYNNLAASVTDGVTIDNLTNISNITTNGGNDTFNITWDAQNNTFDAQGQTTVDAANYTAAVNLAVSYTGGGNATVVNGGNTDTLIGFEDIRAGGGNDTFTIQGDGINNGFNGGAGSDTADYTLSAAGLTFNLDGGVESVVAGAGTDQLTSFENIIASNQADIFNVTGAGEAQYTTLNGNAGNDIFNIDWGVTANTFDGGLGSDSYVVGTTATNLTVSLSGSNWLVTNGAATDTLTSIADIATSNGNDTFTITWDGQNHTFDANGNTAVGDTADFSGTSNPATYDLTVAGTITVVNGAQTDTLLDFESFIAGSGNDIFDLTSAAGEVAYTALNGSGGDNTFNVFWGSTNTAINGGSVAGNNSYVISNTITTDLTVNTVTGVITDGASSDTLTNIDNITTSNGNDTFTITWDAQNNAYDGSGNTAGGQDTAVYTAAVALTVNYTGTGTDTVVNGGTTDTLSNFEAITTGGQDDIFLIEGDALDNTFNGGAHVTATGDTASYLSSTTGLTFDLNGATATATSTAGGVDTLVNFETIIASNLADTFNLGAGGESLYTSLDGKNGNNTFNVFWGSTNTVINGGSVAGNNSYIISNIITTNLTVNTVTGIVTDGASSDTLTNIDNITTSNGNDTFTITWDAQNNAYDGSGNTAGGQDAAVYTAAVALTVNYTGAGNATVVNGTTDTLANMESISTGTGNDTFNITWDTIDNSFNSGTGTTDTANYSPSSTALTFTLDGGSEAVSDGTNTDTLIGFDAIQGGSGADTFNLSTNSYGSIVTNAGNDTINVTDAAFGATNTNVQVNGGADTDTYAYSGSSALTVSLLAASNTVVDGGNTHTLSNIETVTLGSTGAVTGTITNPTQVTQLNTGAGNDVITAGNAGSVTSINTNAGDDTVSLTQDAQSTTVDGGTNTVAGDTFTSTTSLVTTVTQTGTTFNVAANSQTDVFQNFENGTLTTGTAADIFTIDTDVAGTWAINAGTGNNQYKFIGQGLGAVQVTVNSGAANTDTLDFTGMTAGITIKAGQTTVQTVIGSFSLILANAIARIEGSPQADMITGTAGNDIINAGDGNDLVYGGAGVDTINGDNGADVIYGGSEITTVITCTAPQQDSGDTITGGTDASADIIYGGNKNAISGANCASNGTDTIDGGDGADTIYGGNENVSGATGNDAGADSITGGAGDDTVYGGNNNANCVAGVGGTGTDAADTLVTGGTGNDISYGGNNNSCAGATGSDGSDTVSDLSGTDQVYGGNNNTGNTTVANNDTNNDTVTTNDTVAGDINYGDNNNMSGGLGVGATGPGDTRNADGTDTGTVGSCTAGC